MWWILLQVLWVHSAVGPAPSGLRSGVPLGRGSKADMTLNFQSYMFDFKSLSLCRVGHLSCKKGEMDHEFCRFEWLEITFLGGRVIQNIFSYIIWLVRGNKHKGNIISGEQLGPWPQDSRHWVEGKGQRLPSGAARWLCQIRRRLDVQPGSDHARGPCHVDITPGISSMLVGPPYSLSEWK